MKRSQGSGKKFEFYTKYDRKSLDDIKKENSKI